MQSSSKSISPAIIKQAKEMYMEYMPVKTIAIQLNTPRTSIQYHVNKSWNLERSLARAEMFKNFSEQKRVTMTTMSEAAIKIMSRAMENLASGEEEPTMQQATQASAILDSLDKILRLDSGTPTAITENRPMSTIELKKKLSLDPFMEVEWTDVDTKQLESESLSE